MNSDGSDQRILLNTYACEVPIGWSPDGRYLLVSVQIQIDSKPTLMKYDLQTHTYTWLANNLQFYPGVGIGSVAVWSPDGKQIAFFKNVDDQNRSLYVINADGTGEINLTNTPSGYINIDWSLDGHWLVFSKKAEDIYIIRPDGSGLSRVTQNTQMDKYPFWIP
jgi:Tol biopolymer transport system component